MRFVKSEEITQVTRGSLILGLRKKSLAYKLSKWSLKDVDIYQAASETNAIQLHYGKWRFAQNKSHKSQDISALAVHILTIMLLMCLLQDP